MPPFNNFTENRPYLRSPYQINRSTCFTPKRRSKQPSRHNPHPSQLNPVVERNLNGTTVSTDRISVRISPESKDPKSFTRNHQRPIDEAKLKNAILSLMVSLGNSDASSAVEERTADPPKKLDKNSLKLENYPPNYESETEGQKLQNSSKNIIKSNDHHPTGDSSFPHDTPTENLVIDATDKTNEKNPELPINVLTDNIDEHPKKYAALSTRPNEARDDDSTGQKNIICFPANVQMATACLSNIKPVSIQSTVKNTPSVYCYRTNDLRSAGIII